MPRSFKISFPLPRRPSASPHTTPGSQYSNQSNIDDSPLSHPGAKAERVLGASEADNPELTQKKKKQSRKEKNQLRKSPSFMSVTLSDMDAESVKTPDEFPFPGMHTPGELLPQPIHDKGRQGSSPLLGEQYMFRSTNGGALSNASSPSARHAESSSTLRSHYDPKKSPLSISQQTSASSARDMALRKGFPPISSPLSLSAVEAVKSIEPDGPHSRNISTDTKASESSKLSGNSLKRINSMPRRRPSVMDPPTLYPNAARAFHATSPPPALINAAILKPLNAQSQQKMSFSRPRWWAKVKTQMPPPIPVEDQQRHEDFDDNLPSIKLNVKKPKAGMQNWFDGVDDEGSLSDGHQDLQVLKHEIPEPYNPPLGIEEIMAQGAPIAERKSSFSENNEPNILSDRKPSFRFDYPPLRSPYSRSSSKAQDEMNTPGSTPGSPDARMVHPIISSKGRTSAIDLQSVSFLELSSSEEEMESNSDAPYRRHRIRASIERASYNNEVSVGNAQRAQPVRPRSIVNGRTRPLSRISNSSEKVPPVPKIPDRPRFSQRNSSVRWREMMEDKAGSTESTVDSAESSLSGSLDARRARTRAKQSIRRSRFMKVTSEEEKLLEAMRDKRASIRQDDFDKGFKTAMQLQDIVARPKTAGADGRTSQSSNYGSRSPTSPGSEVHARKTSRTNVRFSASAEDLRLGDAYPFPEVPLSRRGPPGLISPSKASSSLSFSPSDILPETPASHNSPMTPPPGQGSLGAYGRGVTSPRGITAMNKMGHERNRTVSSSVVDLDEVEEQAQVIDEEDMARWAMDRW